MGTESSKPSNEGSSVQSDSYPATSNDSSRPAARQPISKIGKHVQQRITKGVNYNMKIIIRGKRNVGKSMLFRRLKGLGFVEQYTPTPEIQTATIDWAPNKDLITDGVKVEVWDVVDKGIMDTSSGRIVGLDASAIQISQKVKKGQAMQGGYRISVLDASMVDVYQDTAGVIFLIDPFDPESLEYVRSLYKEVPYEMPILIMQNFRDKFQQSSQSKPVSEETQPELNHDADNKPHISLDQAEKHLADLVEDIRFYRKGLRQKICFESWSEEDAESSSEQPVFASTQPSFYSLPSAITEDVHSMQVSMLNCYGLQELYRYLAIPFLRLRQRALEEQLYRGRAQLDEAETNLLKFSADHSNSYAAYMNKFVQLQRERAERAEHASQALKHPVSSPIPTRDAPVPSTLDDSSADEANPPSNPTNPTQVNPQSKPSKLPSKQQQQSVMPAESDDDDSNAGPRSLTRIRRKVNPSKHNQSQPSSSHTKSQASSKPEAVNDEASHTTSGGLSTSTREVPVPQQNAAPHESNHIDDSFYDNDDASKNVKKKDSVNNQQAKLKPQSIQNDSDEDIPSSTLSKISNKLSKVVKKADTQPHSEGEDEMHTPTSLKPNNHSKSNVKVDIQPNSESDDDLPTPTSSKPLSKLSKATKKSNTQKDSESEDDDVPHVTKTSKAANKKDSRIDLPINDESLMPPQTKSLRRVAKKSASSTLTEGDSINLPENPEHMRGEDRKLDNEDISNDHFASQLSAEVVSTEALTVEAIDTTSGPSQTAFQEDKPPQTLSDDHVDLPPMISTGLYREDSNESESLTFERSSSIDTFPGTSTSIPTNFSRASLSNLHLLTCETPEAMDDCSVGSSIQGMGRTASEDFVPLVSPLQTTKIFKTFSPEKSSTKQIDRESDEDVNDDMEAKDNVVNEGQQVTIPTNTTKSIEVVSQKATSKSRTTRRTRAAIRPVAQSADTDDEDQPTSYLSSKEPSKGPPIVITKNLSSKDDALTKEIDNLKVDEYFDDAFFNDDDTANSPSKTPLYDDAIDEISEIRKSHTVVNPTSTVEDDDRIDKPIQSSQLSREAQLAIQQAMLSWTDPSDGTPPKSKKSTSKKSSTTRKSKAKPKPALTQQYDYDSETEF